MALRRLVYVALLCVTSVFGLASCKATCNAECVTTARQLLNDGAKKGVVPIGGPIVAYCATHRDSLCPAR